MSTFREINKVSYERCLDLQKSMRDVLGTQCVPLFLPERCMICSEEDGKGRCRQTGVVYEIVCESCKSKYIGETSRNGYTRGREHAREYDKKSKNSVLYRHTTEKHMNDRQPPKYSMKIISSHRTALDRQIAESVRIASTRSCELINSKQEFGHNRCWRFELSAD